MVLTYPAASNTIISGMPLFIGRVLMAVITIVGINITFKTTRGNEGSNYISRMIMLGKPIFINTFIVIFITSLVVSMIGFATGYLPVTGGVNINPWLVVVINTLILIIIYWRFNTHLNYINA